MPENAQRRIRVCLADAPRDVLVWLVDNGPQSTGKIAAGCAPADADAPDTSARRACALLCQMGYADITDNGWRATEEGHAAVLGARLAADSESSAVVS